MKKLRLSIFLLATLGLFMFASCGGADENTSEGDSTEQSDDQDESDDQSDDSHVMYQCPDNCNEGRAFFDPGTCEKCGKEMVEI